MPRAGHRINMPGSNRLAPVAQSGTLLYRRLIIGHRHCRPPPLPPFPHVEPFHVHSHVSRPPLPLPHIIPITHIIPIWHTPPKLMQEKNNSTRPRLRSRKKCVGQLHSSLPNSRFWKGELPRAPHPIRAGRASQRSSRGSPARAASRVLVLIDSYRLKGNLA